MNGIIGLCYLVVCIFDNDVFEKVSLGVIRFGHYIVQLKSNIYIRILCWSSEIVRGLDF